MTGQPDQIVTFISSNGHVFAFLGVHLIGAVRETPGDAGWICYLERGPDGSAWARWRGAESPEAARAALISKVGDWYDAAHTPLKPGQGERLARHARVA